MSSLPKTGKAKKNKKNGKKRSINDVDGPVNETKPSKRTLDPEISAILEKSKKVKWPEEEEDDKNDDTQLQIAIQKQQVRAIKQEPLDSEESLDSSKDTMSESDDESNGLTPRPTPNNQNVPIFRRKFRSISIIVKNLLCPVPGCKEIVLDKISLDSHLLSSHKLKYGCLMPQSQVPASSAPQSQLSKDSRKENSTKWACQCAKKLKSYGELKKHFWRKHQIGLFSCSVDDCQFESTTIPEIKIHLKTHQAVQYPCPDDNCDLAFQKMGQVAQHFLIHSGERPFPCTECDKFFAVQSALTKHLKFHRTDGALLCNWPLCDYVTSHGFSIVCHIRVTHFQLPALKKEQIAQGIVDNRNPYRYIVKNKLAKK